MTIISKHRTGIFKGDDPATWDEPKLAALAERVLAPHFEIETEVWGTYLLTNDRIRIDYLLFPKPHLVNEGFVEQWVGLEVKSPNVKQKHKQVNALIWQAITYRMSSYNGRTLAMVLLFPGLAHFMDDENGIIPRSFQSMLVRGNIGHLSVYPSGDFGLHFAGSAYYTTKYGLCANPSHALKIRVGNSK